MVPVSPQLARKMGQLGEVQGVGKGTRSRAPSLPYSKENKVMGSFPSDQGILRGRGKEEEAGRKTGLGKTRGKTSTKDREQRTNPTKGKSLGSLPAPQAWALRHRRCDGSLPDHSPPGIGFPL